MSALKMISRMNASPVKIPEGIFFWGGPKLTSKQQKDNKRIRDANTGKPAIVKNGISVWGVFLCGVQV